jgi:hypothetical protein
LFVGGLVIDVERGLAAGVDAEWCGAVDLVLGRSGIRSWRFGGKRGSSGCRITEWRRRETRRVCGRVER